MSTCLWNLGCVPSDAQVGGLAGHDQRHEDVGVAGEHGETHAAQEDQQVPVIQKRFLDVLAQAHGARFPSGIALGSGARPRWLSSSWLIRSRR